MTDDNIIEDPALLFEFIADAKELLENMDPILLEFEKDPMNSQLSNELLRSLHTIKGTSAFLGLKNINILSHKTEDVLKAVQEEKIKPDAKIINLVFESVDILKGLVNRITRAEDIKIEEYLGDDVKSGLAIKNIEIALEGKESSASTPQLPSNLLDQFVIEANEHFDIIEPLLIKLEKNPHDIEAINNIFRSVHTVKGNSDYAGLTEIKELSHKIEGLLDRLRKEKITLTMEIVEIMFEGIDTLKILIGNLNLEDPERVSTGNVIRRLEKLQDEGLEARPSGLKEHEERATLDKGLKIFINSAGQHLEAICKAVKEITEEGERDSALDMLLRSVSTLKNSAEYMGQDEIAKTAEAILNTANAMGTIGFDTILVDGLSHDLAELKKSLSSLGGKLSVPERHPARERKAPIIPSDSKPDPQTTIKKLKIKEVKTVRVDQEKLDVFMNLVGELVVTRNAFYHLTEKVEQEHKLTEIAEKIKGISSQMERISDGLQSKVMEMRMVPVKNVFQRFPRMVRDLAIKMNKKVELVIQGEETEIDKAVAEAVGDPLVHLIRNAADHGIEPVEERVAAGKNEKGTIILKAGHEGSTVAIEIIDDGKGIDEEKVKKKAIEKGLVTKSAAEQLSRDNIINFILSPGFSTAGTVTDVSGRGVGMDVVKSNIQKIKGTIDIHTDYGCGTKIKLNLPLTLAVFEALMVGIGKETYAIPLESVKETMKVQREDIVTLRGKEVVNLRGDILSVARLSEMFNVSSANGRIDLPIVVIQAIGKTIGIAVDELFKQEDILIKPLDKFLSTAKGILGSTITGDGKVILVLDPAEIVALI